MISRRTMQTAAAIICVLVAAASLRAAEPTPLCKIEGHTTSVCFAPDGKMIAGDLALRKLPSGKIVAQGRLEEDFPCCEYVAFSPDGKRLASVHDNAHLTQMRHEICLWNVAGQELRLAATLPLPKEDYPRYRWSLYHLLFSPDGRMLATRHPDDATIIWETLTGKERLRLETHGLAIAFAPDNRTLICVTRDGRIQHWDLRTRSAAIRPATPRATNSSLWIGPLHRPTARRRHSATAIRS